MTDTKVNTMKNFLGSMSGEDLQAMFQALQEMMDEGEEQAKPQTQKRFTPYKVGSEIPDEIRMQYMRQTENGNWRWMPNRLAEHLCRLTDAKYVDGVVWFRDEDGAFRCLDSDWNTFDRIIYWHYKDVSARQQQDVRDMMLTIAPVGHNAPVNLVAFKGPGQEMQILDLDTRTIHKEEEYPKDVFFLNVIPHALPLAQDGSIDMEFTNPVTDQLIGGIACNNPKIIQQLEELIGYPMLRDSFRYKKCFVLYGDGDNGKSALVKSVAEMYGASNVSSLNIDQFGQDFMTVSLMGKMVNLSDDMTGGYLPATAVALLKSLTAGGEILANRKYKTAIPMTCYAKLIFAANDLASMQDRTGAAANRFQIIPLKQDFKKVPDKDPMITEKMQAEEAQQALIVYGLRGLFRILDTGHFTETEETVSANNEMRADNSSVIQWLDDEEGGRMQLYSGRPPKDVYRDYKDWCEFCGVKPVKYFGWQKEVGQQAGYRVTRAYIDGHYKRVFFTEEEAEEEAEREAKRLKEPPEFWVEIGLDAEGRDIDHPEWYAATTTTARS